MGSVSRVSRRDDRGEERTATAQGRRWRRLLVALCLVAVGWVFGWSGLALAAALVAGTAVAAAIRFVALQAWAFRIHTQEGSVR